MNAFNRTVNAARVQLNVREGARFGPLERCQVLAVDTDHYTCTVFMLTSRVTIPNVPIAQGYLMADHGVLAMPEVGATGIAAWLPRQRVVLLGFLTLPYIRENDPNPSHANDAFGLNRLPALSPGEVHVGSAAGAIFRMSGDGSIRAYTSSLRGFEVSEISGVHRIGADGLREDSLAHHHFVGLGPDTDTGLPMQGQYNQDLLQVFESPPGPSGTAADVAAGVLSGTAGPGATPTQTPIYQRVIGTVQDASGNVLDLVAGGTNYGPMAYQAQVMKNGQAVASIGIDKSGNVGITVAGDLVLQVGGNLNLTANGPLMLQGKDFLAHTHTAPAGGGTTSGVN